MVAEFSLLFDLGLVILAGAVLGFIVRELRQPLIIGYIAAGLLIGPMGLQLISDYGVIAVLSELGVAFLLFAIGMEIDFSKLSRFKKTILIGGLAEIIITTMLVMGLSLVWTLPWLESIYLGLIVAFSSSVIAIKLLTDAKQLNSLEGKLIIGYALVQDLLAVLVLPLLENPLMLFSLDRLAILAGSFILMGILGVALGKYVFPRITSEAAKSQEIFFLITISSCFLFLFLSGLLGFPMAVGAFIGGLALGRIPHNLEALTGVHYIRDLFGTVFFVSLGLQLKALTFGTLFWIMLFVVFVLNPLVFTGINLLLGFGLQTSLIIGLSLFQASEFSFIIARQGLSLGHLSQEAFDAAIWVILLSMVATPYMLSLQGRLYKIAMTVLSPWKQHFAFFEREVRRLQQLDPKPFFRHIVIMGAGVFGGQLAQTLHSQRHQVLVLEQDPDVVKALCAQGITALYSSRNNAGVLDKIGLEDAQMLIVTIPDPKSAEMMVRLARQKNPTISIFARAHSHSDATALYRAGADMVVMPQVIAGNYTLSQIQKSLSTGKRPTHGFAQDFLESLGDQKENVPAFLE